MTRGACRVMRGASRARAPDPRPPDGGSRTGEGDYSVGFSSIMPAFSSLLSFGVITTLQ